MPGTTTHTGRSQQDRFLPIREVVRITSLSRACIYKYIGQQKFPASVNLSGNRVAWLNSEIDRWMQERVAARAPSDLPG